MIFISIFTALFFICWVWIDLYHDCKNQQEEISIFGFFFMLITEYSKKVKKYNIIYGGMK